jgi:hypothetical protein
MSFIVWLDADGKEIRREKKQRGRPPKGSVKKEDGNFYVSPSNEDETIYYIETDTKGKVLSKIPRGRGRPRPGFVKNPADGHWYRSQKQTPEKAAK